MTGSHDDLELPIEPLPTGPLIPRPGPETAMAEPPMRNAPEREETDVGALRPSAPSPVSSTHRPRREPAPRPVDRRHPVRGTLGLLALALLASLALAAAVGIAIVLVAFAVRQAVA